MGICACGKLIKKNRDRCVRCRALQEIGLNAGASTNEIKSAYRVLVKKWHPDQFARDRRQQHVAEEKLKRVNVAYKRLTSPSKGKGVPAQPEPPASSEPKQKPTVTRRVSTQSPKQGALHRPQPDFKKWKAEFDRQFVARSNAAKGLNKWIGNEEANRVANIARVESVLKNRGLDPGNSKKLPQPEDTRSDLMQWLWSGSAPNMEERTRAADEDNELLKQIEQLADSAKELGARLQSRSTPFFAQDRLFEIPLTGLPKDCLELSSSLRKVSILARRKHIYPRRIADCCMSLVFEMEDRSTLSPKECHALIRCALLAHGCTPTEVSPFDEEFIERGTIGAKKEALRAKVLKSANLLYVESRKS